MSKVLYDEQAVDLGIKQMAVKVEKRYRGKDPLFVCLLRGGAPFAMKLMFEITKLNPTFYPEMDYMIIKTYGTGRRVGMPRLVTDLAPHTLKAGRLIVMLDDTLDKGVTAAFATDHMTGVHHSGKVELLVLVEKKVKRERYPHATLSCFGASSEWLIGMGLDDGATGKEAGRWASNISVI